jgi:hypothetical protein
MGPSRPDMPVRSAAPALQQKKSDSKVPPSKCTHFRGTKNDTFSISRFSPQ